MHPSSCFVPVKFGCRFVCGALFWNLAMLPGQTLILGSGPGGGVNIFNTDLAVLEAGDVRKDLPCSVTPAKPILGFDLKFHAGYEVTIPLKELAGTENVLTILFRVEAEEHRDKPYYFVQRVHVPLIEDEAKGDAYLQGGFDLGEGAYHVDWLMRDRAEKVCSFYWDSNAQLAPKDKLMDLAIVPGAIQRSDAEQFKEEPPVQRAQQDTPLNVKVLINFAPQSIGSATLQPLDTAALVSILRSIAREPRIGKFSIIAFNMQEERVVYRQEGADRIDFPALGRALGSVSLGTVDLKRLGEKHGDSDFLADLLKKEVGNTGADQHPDALIFAGPKVTLDSGLPTDALKDVNNVDFPIFYMNYNLNPQANPWKDAIGNAVKHFRGYEYTISKPRDLWFAVSDLVARVVKSRNGKRPASISSE